MIVVTSSFAVWFNNLLLGVDFGDLSSFTCWCNQLLLAYVPISRLKLAKEKKWYNFH